MIDHPCVEITVPHRAPAPRVHRPSGPPRVIRIRIGPPVTHKADVVRACPTEEQSVQYVSILLPQALPGAVPELRTSRLPKVVYVPDGPQQFQPWRPYSVRPPTVVSPVPEPSTWLMLICGFMGIGAALRNKKKAWE